MNALDKSVAIIEFDSDGNFTYVNNNYLALTGYKLAEVLGRNHAIFVDRDEWASEEYADFWRSLRSGKFQSAEFRRIGKGGRAFWIRGSYNPVLDSEGHVTRIVKFAMDITERKELEAKLIAASSAKDLFLANMSHELRTPLNGIMGLLESLETTELDARQHEMLRIISNASHTLERVLGDMLELTRIAAGKIAIEARPFALRPEIQAAIYFHREVALEKGLEFNLSIASDVPVTVALDPIRFKQVLSNLVSNAVKFTDFGQVAIDVSSVDDGNTGRLKFVVSDTGIGMDPSRIAELFEPFTQADPSISRRFGGTGLGLAICRSLALALGGDLTVTSELEVGSAFTFDVPFRVVAEQSTPDLPKRQIPSKAPQLRSKILVADDHPSNRLVLELMLAPFGAEIIAVGDGAAAVAAFLAEHPACILMDMQMPVLDGLEATHRIRALEAEKDLGRTPIIMVTANALEVHQSLATAAGVDFVLTKPIGLSALISSLEMFL